MNWFSTGACIAFLAVILGTFGAHGIPTVFEKTYKDIPERMIAGSPVPAAHKAIDDFKTGVYYQMVHAFAIMLMALWKQNQANRLLDIVGHLFTWGCVFFSGSLYILTLSTVKLWGMVAPIGGTLFIGGWICLIIATYRAPKSTIPA
jgi:uncharacterized membrane protein YgdD (TMEM256/DUF423 family)